MFGAFNPADLSASLTIMWQGMVGIFAVMLLITAIVSVFSKVSSKKK